MKKSVGFAIAAFALAVLVWTVKPWEYFISEPPAPPVIIQQEQEFIEFADFSEIPVSLTIPFLEIDAPIVGVGITAEGNMDTTQEPYGIAWYQKGASPGGSGNALLAGHNYWNGTSGSFVKLAYLPIGESMQITYEDGSVGYFLVISNETYELDEIPDSVMTLKGETRTTLISCNGKRLSGGGYSQRTIVLAKAVELKPLEP